MAAGHRCMAAGVCCAVAAAGAALALFGAGGPTYSVPAIALVDTNVLKAAGIPYSSTSGGRGIVTNATYGSYGERPAPSASRGVESRVVLYANVVAAVPGGVLVYGDSARTNVMGVIGHEAP